MDKKTAYDIIIKYFNDHTEEFNQMIEELNSYSGFAEDDMFYEMDILDEFFSGTEPCEILRRAFYGYDADTWTKNSYGEKEYGPFNPNRKYFSFNGYGNFISSDYKDYTHLLDDYFVEELIKYASNVWYLPEAVKEIIESIEE